MYNIQIMNQIYLYKIHFHISMRESLKHFSFIACNSMIASNKQRPKHNNQATIWRPKLKGVHEHSKSLQFINT